VLELARTLGVSVHTPIDAVIRRNAGTGPSYEELALDRALLSHEAAVDLGPDTCSAYGQILARSATVLWVGLLGECSGLETQGGSIRVGQMAALAPRAMVVGDDTVQAIRDFRLDQQFKTAAGGDAVLALLAGEVFPGFEALSR
jgi:3-phosphoglycerate kinase